MTIQSRTDPNIKLFHTITPHWQGEGLMFYFLPHVRREAEKISEGLLTYLRFYEAKEQEEEVVRVKGERKQIDPMGIDIFDGLFNTNSKEEALTAMWDPIKGQEDVRVEELLAGEDSYDLTKFSEVAGGEKTN